MKEKFDLKKMQAEIKKDEELEKNKPGLLTQEEIQRFIREKTDEGTGHAAGERDCSTN
jgi:hypothetical protein